MSINKLSGDVIERWLRGSLDYKPLSMDVGFLETATYATKDDDNVTYVATVAYNNNYGNGVPKRPFFEKAVADDNMPYEVYANALMMGNSPQKALELTGQYLKQEVQKTIIEIREPPNAPATIKKKGSSNPLVDTGHMGDSVDYIIEDKR